MPPILARLILFALLVAPAQAQPQAWAWDDGTVPYVNTPIEIVERMMRMAEVRAGDYVIDLGSGDGRIVIEAAKRGARGLGVDLDPNLVKLATQNARQAGVADRARFETRDIFETELSAASVVTMYLLPDFNKKLLPRLLALKPGTRFVSHDGSIGDWPADETLEMRTPEKPVGVGGISRVELWIVPAEVRGVWQASGTQIRIHQNFQEIELEGRLLGREITSSRASLRGREILWEANGLRFQGRLQGGLIAGELIGPERRQPLALTRSR
jgi:SAM-dependent methyltransferase